ncbi:hypothetical protein V8E36_000522 [Tilletia maclaganii]
MFKSIRRPGTADSSRRKRGFGEGSTEAEESDASTQHRRCHISWRSEPEEHLAKDDGRLFHFSPRTHRDAGCAKVEFHALAYTPTLSVLIAQSDLVVGHAGSGTILKVLRTSPQAPALIVVPFHTLMDDHQSELALALSRDGVLSMGHLRTGEWRGRGARR